ncbi:MAG: FG-GAP-like repeat-containing protein, partial [Planctomycetota bacterium]|nr:FG-GAP-like repeat-containing protein [Planctomycetota bacterium]
MKKNRLAAFLLGPALVIGVVGAEETVLFVDSGQALGNNNSYSVALGDLDGDGDIDAMVANTGLSGVSGESNTVWTNDGNGLFTNSQALGNGRSTSVALGDLDGDGDLDAMVANGIGFFPNTVWTNDGSGTFTNSG